MYMLRDLISFRPCPTHIVISPVDELPCELRWALKSGISNFVEKLQISIDRAQRDRALARAAGAMFRKK
jgi:hypothetical protein